MATLRDILLKAKGKKDTTKLQKKTIIDRTGKRTSVWVRVGEQVKEYGGKLFDILNGFFGKGKFKSKKDIDAHVKTLKNQGAPAELDTDHFIEYFTHKSKWDAKFSGSGPKVGAVSKNTAGEKEHKESGGHKRAGGSSTPGKQGERAGGSGGQWNTKVMEYLSGKYGDKNSDKNKGKSDDNFDSMPNVTKKLPQVETAEKEKKSTAGDKTGGSELESKLTADFSEYLKKDVREDPHYISATPEQQKQFLADCDDNAQVYVKRVIKQVQAKDRAWLESNLHTGNKGTRKMFKQITGIDLGSTKATTKAGIEQWISGDGESEKSQLSPAEKKTMTQALTKLKPISDEFNKIVSGKRSYHLEEVYGDDRAIKIGGRGYAKKDFTDAQLNRMYEIKSEIDTVLKPIKHESYNLTKNEIHITKPAPIKGEDKEATRTISDKIGAGEKSEHKQDITKITQEWIPTEINKKGLLRSTGKSSDPEPIEPKYIYDAFRVWGETFIIIKRGSGFMVMEKKTGLMVGQIKATQSDAIESAKMALDKQGKDALAAAIANSKPINSDKPLAKANEKQFGKPIFSNGLWI